MHSMDTIRTLLEKAQSHRLFLVFKYGISGCVGAAIQLVTDYVFVEYLHLSYLLGTAVGFVIAVVVTFILQKYWTFGDSEHGRAPRQFFLYGLVAFGSLALNVVLMHFFVEWMSVWYMLAQMYTIVIVTGASFVCNNLLTFKESNFFKKT